MKITDITAEEIILAGNSKNDLPAAFYISKRRQLEYMLDQLNIIDHPAEIRRICQDIVNVKKKLQQIELRKKLSH